MVQVLPEIEVAEKVMVLSARAEKKWAQLDVDGNGTLDEDEVLQLAEWVWCSFRPGHAITKSQQVAEATKILRRCDKNDDGKVDKDEFQAYYDATVKGIFRSGPSPLPAPPICRCHQKLHRMVGYRIQQHLWL